MICVLKEEGERRIASGTSRLAPQRYIAFTLHFGAHGVFCSFCLYLYFAMESAVDARRHPVRQPCFLFAQLFAPLRTLPTDPVEAKNNLFNFILHFCANCVIGSRLSCQQRAHFN